MTPTGFQYWFASAWPALAARSIGLCVFGCAILCTAVATTALWPVVEFQPHWTNWAWYLFHLLAALLFGLLVGFLIGLYWMILFLFPVQWLRARMNGAPFQEGDWVRILAGAQRDRIVRVKGPWPRGEVQVDMGEDEAGDNTHHFPPWGLCRATPPV
ncbi:MAG: hypothetical protein HYY93_09995 [Planctomycetes bacterium]|nr:hypothetical protein [Planctomycetota bacterium]